MKRLEHRAREQMLSLGREIPDDLPATIRPVKSFNEVRPSGRIATRDADELARDEGGPSTKSDHQVG